MVHRFLHLPGPVARLSVFAVHDPSLEGPSQEAGEVAERRQFDDAIALKENMLLRFQVDCMTWPSATISGATGSLVGPFFGASPPQENAY